MTSAWCTILSIIAEAMVASPKTWPQREKGKLEVKMMEDLIAGGDELEEQVGCFGVERDVADPSITMSP